MFRSWITERRSIASGKSGRGRGCGNPLFLLSVIKAIARSNSITCFIGQIRAVKIGNEKFTLSLSFPLFFKGESVLHQLNSSLCSVTCLFISDSGGINNSLFAWNTDLINSATHPRPGCLWEHLPLTGPSRPRVKLRAPSLPYSPSGEGPECPARPGPAANGAFGEGELGAAARSSPLPLPPGTPGEAV